MTEQLVNKGDANGTTPALNTPFDSASGDKPDKAKLIENGTGTPSSPEAPNSYGEVSPLHLDAPSENKTSEGLKVIVVSCVVFALGVTVALIVTIYCAPPQVPLHGAVSSDSEQCSNVGADLLKKGGTAVDAAIGTLFCLSVVQPESSGLGGGGFLVLRNHKAKSTHSINFRESAPQQVTPSDLDDATLTSDTKITGKFVGVPGFLKGMKSAHTSYGSLKWEELVQPSVDIAKIGYTLSDNGAWHLKNYADCSKMSVAFAQDFCKDGALLKKGDIVKRMNYSMLLEKIAKQGADDFYEGETANEIIRTVSDNGGQMALSDLKNYAVTDEKVITSTTFQNMSVESVSAPSGGPLLLFMLNVLNSYDLRPKDHNTTLFYHRFIEVTKFANALDESLGDPTVTDSVKDQVNHMISEDFAKIVVGKINDTVTHPDAYYFTSLGLKRRRKRSTQHTTHVSVIGPNEDHVAVTSSLNSNFGSRLVTPSGIFLNNQLLDFDSPKQQHSNPANQMVGGARPQSHMAPTVTHSRDRPCGLRLATGAVGGWAITSEIALTMTNLLAFNMTLEQSIEQPRIFYDTGRTNAFVYEEGLNPSVVQQLAAMGHNLTSITKDSSHQAVNSAMKVNETLSAHADSRRGGVAVVF